MSNNSFFPFCDYKDSKGLYSYNPFTSEEVRGQDTRAPGAFAQANQQDPFPQPGVNLSLDANSPYGNPRTTNPVPLSILSVGGEGAAPVQARVPSLFEYPRYICSDPPPAAGHDHRSMSTANMPLSVSRSASGRSNLAEHCIPSSDIHQTRKEQNMYAKTNVERNDLPGMNHLDPIMGGQSRSRLPLYVKDRADKTTHEAMCRLDSAPPIIPSSSSSCKKWCSMHQRHDTCTLSNPPPKSTYVSFGSAIMLKDAASRVGEVSSTVPVLKADAVGTEHSHLFTENQPTSTRGAVAYTGDEEKKRHEEWIRRMRERDRKLEEKCKAIKEEGLRRLAAAAAAAAAATTTSAGGYPPSAAKRGDMLTLPPKRGDSSQREALVRGLRERKMQSEKATPLVITPRSEVVGRPEMVGRQGESVSLGKVNTQTACGCYESANTKEEVARTTEAVKTIVAEDVDLDGEVDVEVKWTSVDLSDDEGWEKVDDEGAEWEVLER